MLAALIAAATTFSMPQSVAASTISVTTTDDELVTNGRCSLREAIRNTVFQAQLHADCPAGTGADTIVLGPGTYQLTIPGRGEQFGATGDLDIRSNLTLRGAGSDRTILDGNRLDRLVEVHGDVHVAFENLTIQNGDAGSDGGGGVQIDSWPSNNSTARFTGVVIRNNRTTDDDGGGILAWGNVTIEASKVIDNYAEEWGGGIESNYGSLTITDSTISGNTAKTGSGGGVVGGPLTITRSTISNNTSGDDGGGILAGQGPLAITNSTVFGNSAEDGGGGIEARSATTITNTTIVGNIANAGGGLYFLIFFLDPPENARLTNVIIAGNEARFGPLTANCRHTDYIWSGGNIEDLNSCGFIRPTDLKNTDPKLGPLADNGGPTRTLALLAGSPAIDGGGSGCVATDQRGVNRPQDGDKNGSSLCDIGAFEVGEFPAVPTPTASPSPTVASSESTVRESGDDSPRQLTAEQRLQHSRTNKGGQDDVHTEGNVTDIGTDVEGPYLILANRDGPVMVRLRCGSQCPTVRPGDYVQVDGQKEHEGLFYADEVTVTRAGR